MRHPADITRSAFKLKLLVCILLSAAVLPQVNARPVLPEQTKEGDAVQHGARQSLLQAGRGARSGPYAAETTIGTPGVTSLTPYFSTIKLPPQAYIEVSDPAREEVYLYGQKDFGHMAAGELFAPLSISGDSARIRVVYPEGTALRQQDAVVLEYWESPPVAAKKSLSSFSLVGDKDDRELSACATAKKPAWHHGSLASAQFTAPGCAGTAWSLGNENFIVTNFSKSQTQQSLANGEVNFNYITSTCQAVPPKQVLKIKPSKLLITGGADTVNRYSMFSLDDFDYQHAKVKYLFGGLELANNRPAVDTPLYIPQHGRVEDSEGRRHYYQTIASSKGNENCKVVRNDGFIRYNCDTSIRSIGAPILSQDGSQVFGMHYGGDSSVNTGMTSENLWKALNGQVSAQQNQAVVGQGQLELAQLNISQQQAFATGQRFSDTLSFTALSGRWLAHEKTYSTIAAASQDIQTGKTYEIVYRVSQNINGQPYNLQQAVAGSKTLNVEYVASDNPNLSSKGPHKSWIGLTANTADGQLANNYLIKINNTIPGDSNGGSESLTSPKASISGPAEVERGPQGGLLSAEKSTGDKLAYSWQSNSKLMLKPRGDKVIVTAGMEVPLGAHQVDLTVTDSQGRSATASHTLQIKAPPSTTNPTAPVARISGGQASYVDGQTIRLDGSGSSQYNGSLNYQWAASPALNMGQTNSSIISFTAPSVQKDTRYQVTLTVKDPANGKDHRTSHTLMVKPKESDGSSTASAFQRDVAYKAKDRVSHAGGVFECKPAPYAGWCTVRTDIQMRHYEPGKGINWSQAWIKVK
ncbi:hypothetical protein [Chromobacterium aquaticum]|uniref:PKD domain-containing protein n=1 Tax=Chromobacterium aquaticum TaxID=467180 RepID=A0ABV8ZT64_9NEIS|nr:hypothetical protein [Chromobacterium aquaticum]MCD5361431.1 hypothetical protein [Chromobacterium aquaticum]